MKANWFLPVIAGSWILLPTERAFANSVAYDNAVTYLGTSQGPSIEDGSEITLVGTQRVVTSVAIAVEIAGETPATVQAQLRLYANDGPYEGSPGTLLWQSGVIYQQIEPGGPRFIDFAVPAIHVPNTFTWTAKLGPPEAQVYFSRFYPPVVGSVRYGYWWYNLGATHWTFLGPVGPFGAIVTAEPEIPTISPWGALLLTLALVCAGTVVISRASRRSSPGRTVGGAARLSALSSIAWTSCRTERLCAYTRFARSWTAS